MEIIAVQQYYKAKLGIVTARHGKLQQIKKRKRKRKRRTTGTETGTLVRVSQMARALPGKILSLTGCCCLPYAILCYELA